VEAAEPLYTHLEAETSDALLARRAAAGDRSAYGHLVEIHWATLVRLARSMVGDGDAEDAVQDALVHAWGKLRGLRDPARFPVWISRVVVRVCLRRKRRGPWPVALTPASADEIASIEPQGGAPAERDAVAGIDLERSLAALAPRQRAVLHLTVVEGMSDSEIADRLGIRAASVRSHRRRARERLARLWKEHER
jgi:RNA polymerase sigma-70 factor (ECF subfamily)